MMGHSILDRCSAAKSFCFCSTPRTGALIISILGTLPSVCYCYTLSYTNVPGYLTTYGVPEHAATIIVYIFTALGILCLVMHLVLLASFSFPFEGLVLLYQWFIIIYLFFDVVLMCVIALMALQGGYLLFATTLLVYEMITWLIVGLVVLPVVNGYRRNMNLGTLNCLIVGDNTDNTKNNIDTSVHV